MIVPISPLLIFVQAVEHASASINHKGPPALRKGCSANMRKYNLYNLYAWTAFETNLTFISGFFLFYPTIYPCGNHPNRPPIKKRKETTMKRKWKKVVREQREARAVAPLVPASLAEVYSPAVADVMEDGQTMTTETRTTKREGSCTQLAGYHLPSKLMSIYKNRRPSFKLSSLTGM